MPTPLEKFQSLLRELFQFEHADLDFGVYRIMNLRRERMEKWLNEELPARALEILNEGGTTADDDLNTRIEAVKAQLLEIDPGGIDEDGIIVNQALESIAKGKEYLKLKSIADLAPTRTVAGMEPLVYNHLYDFFSRYYDSGDFIPKRRRSFAPDGRDTYAIPWDGEEVVMHWANKDQYYIKTGDRFTHYRWQSNVGGRTFQVEFRLTDADLPANNNKDAKKKFNLLITDKVEWEEDKATLILPFHYRGLTPEEEGRYTGTQEAKLRESVIKRTLDTLREMPIVTAVPQLATALMAPKRDAARQEKRDNNGNAVPLLSHHLNRWAVKNESDFFIHKDLRRFLMGELDYYLKSVVLNLDNLLAAGLQRAEPNFRLLAAVKRLGSEIVDFVSQLENFQKALFEKRKFVTAVHYCVTLDRVPESMYPLIISNNSQVNEWKRLFHIQLIEADTTQPGYSEPLTIDFLKAHQSLLVDTSFFSEEINPGFTQSLLESKELLSGSGSLDEAFDGILVEGENYQVLNALKARFESQVQCIYIDPPYNTGSDGFPYKDSYQHSSWLAMMRDRLSVALKTLPNHGVIYISIGEEEVTSLHSLLDSLLGSNNRLGTVVWKARVKPVNIGMAKYRPQNETEYVLAYELEDDAAKFQPLMTGGVRTYPHTFNGRKYRTATILKSNRGSNYRSTMSSELQGYTPPEGQRWQAGPDEISWLWDNDYIEFNNGTPSRRYFEDEEGAEHDPFYCFMEQEWSGTSEAGKSELNHLLGNDHGFDTVKPKRLVATLLMASAPAESWIMDFFGGSGTTGHAAMHLFRETGERRHFILVESGAYFERLLKPRILKAAYSKDWKDSKPLSREGMSSAFKCLQFESYDDTLDNIEFNTTSAPGSDLGLDFHRDYELRYALDWESKDCPTRLAIEQLDTPFDYTLTLRRESGTVKVKPDLPETFAYLIGLHTRRRFRTERNGVSYLIYTGTLHADGTEVAVLWRTCQGWKEVDLKAEMDWWRDQCHTLAPGATRIYVNGASTIEGHHSLDAEFKTKMHGGTL